MHSLHCSSLIGSCTTVSLFVANYVGPFVDLDAESIEEEVGNMWRTMHKLSRTFAENPHPKRSSEVTKSRLDKFKKHIPLLQVFCNPGIRDRHWTRVKINQFT